MATEQAVPDAAQQPEAPADATTETQQGSAPSETPAARFEQLKVSAMKEYALRNYAAAAELYSEAAELQDEINGEMSLDNAEILYHYGRSLYQVGVSKSDVLGGKVAQQDEPKRKKRKIQTSENGAASSSADAGAAQPVKTESSLQAIERKPDAATPASKPFFQITGDENWTDSEEEEDAEDEEEAEEEDDFAIAYEILDTARILFKRKIDSLSEAPNTDDNKTRQAEIRVLRERLADTHDLQAEIKLENEQFTDAVNDAREALAIKLELFPQESGMVAEAHYKLSIALDFASLPTQPAESENDPPVKQEEGKLDEAMRDEAAEQMEKAIMSCQAKIKKEEASLASLEGNKLESAKRGIADTQDMVKDMKIRLADLRSTPATLAGSANGGGAGDDGGSGAPELRGIMGELLGSSKAEQARLIQAATQQANDLSGLVKKKKPKVESAAESPSEVEGKGKRKADDSGSARETTKKVKFEVDLP